MKETDRFNIRHIILHGIEPSFNEVKQRASQQEIQAGAVHSISEQSRAVQGYFREKKKKKTDPNAVV